MPLIFFAVFIIVPLVEIALFIAIGGAIGLWPTLGLILLTAIIGTAVIRMQSFGVIEQARAKIEQGVPPVKEMGHGAGLILAGLFLITPGFFTDVLGFALLVPLVRRMIGQILAHYGVFQTNMAGPDRSADGDTIIDGDYSDVTETPESAKPANKNTGKPALAKPSSETTASKKGPSPWGR